MRSPTRSLGALLLALSTVLLVAAPSAPAHAAEADAQSPRVITNVAEIEWDQPSGPASRARSARARLASNRVDIQVTVPAATPFALAVYRFSSSAGTVKVNIAAPRCETGGAAVTAELATGW